MVAWWGALLVGVVLAVFAVLLVVAAVTIPRAVRADELVELDAAIVLVADVSGSMSDDEKDFVRGAHAHALTSRQFLEGIAEGRHKRIAVAYVEFGSTAETVVPWRIIGGLDEAVLFAEALLDAVPTDVHGSTSIAAGLAKARGLLQAVPWAADKFVVDVVGDGVDDRVGGISPGDVRPALLDLGATVNGLPLVIAPEEPEEILIAYYREEVATGATAFVLPVRELEDLPSTLRVKLVLELF